MAAMMSTYMWIHDETCGAALWTSYSEPFTDMTFGQLTDTLTFIDILISIYPILPPSHLHL